MALSNSFKSDLINEVTLSLGGSLVDVELSEADYLLCFKKAVRTFKQRGHNSYRRNFIKLPVEKGVRTYTIPEDIDIDTIVRIIRPGTGFSLEDPFSMIMYNDLFSDVSGGCACSCSGGFDSLSYQLTLDKIESMKRLFIFETQFQYDKFRRELTLYKAPAGTEQGWLLDCYVNLTDDEYSTLDWIIRWTIAEAKNMIGIAYRKIGVIATPTGDTQLSGADYISESVSEKEILLEEILNFVDGEIDYMEIRFG